MQTQDIENVELVFLSMDDYAEFKEAMLLVYESMPELYWKEQQIKTLVENFPAGQIVIKINGEIAGAALSIIVNYDDFSRHHTYGEITGNYTFSTHDNSGDILYGVEVFIKPKFRGLRLGRRLYDYRKELCEKLNLKGIAFGGRIPYYHKYEHEISPKEYLERVKRKEIHDPVLNFQMSNDFHPSKILKGYLAGDKDSSEFAVLLEWDNIYYEKPTKNITAKKRVVRLGLIQWQMRPYKNVDDLLQQAEYFIDAVSGYRADFALFPEFFNAPLMAENNHLSEPEAIRKLAVHTNDIVKNGTKSISIPSSAKSLLSSGNSES